MKHLLINADVLDGLKSLDSESVDLVLTSPPYWGLRKYGVEGELGLEPSMEAYLDNLLGWVKEVWRVLKPTGSFVLNIGDCYCGSWGGSYDKQKGIGGQKSQPYGGATGLKHPERTANYYKPKQLLLVSAFAYCRIVSETDFVCRNEALWCKPNVPSPIRSRLKHSHEKLFWFVKDADEYYFNPKPWMKTCGKDVGLRGKYGRSSSAAGQGSIARELKAGDFGGNETIEHSWRVVPVGERQKGFEVSGRAKQVHVAPFPEALVKPWVESLCPEGGTVLDPFVGSGTVLKVARNLGLNSIGIDLDAAALEYAKKRINWANGVDSHEYEFKEVGERNK